MTKFQQVLKIAEEYEAQGKAFYSRSSNDDMTIHVRDPRLWGGNPNTEHWANAQLIESLIHKAGGRTLGINIDQNSSTLVIQVLGIYKQQVESAETNPEFDKSVGE